MPLKSEGLLGSSELNHMTALYDIKGTNIATFEIGLLEAR